MSGTTIKDVAREAGVSTATVSRVMSGNGPVAETTRRRVLAVISSLGYTPNVVAQSLVNRGTKNLALFVPDIMNPFFPSIARGVADAVASEGYALVLCNTDDELGLGPHYERLLRGRFVDGVILCGAAGDGSVASLIPPDLPVVAMDRRIPALRADTVQIDNRHGAMMATRHLLEVGCRRILHLGGPAGISTAEDRLAGYRQALEEAPALPGLAPGRAPGPASGITFDPVLVTRGPFQAESGYARAKSALERGLDFDGVFAANDLIALGALQALARSGRRVPEEVAVVGFDDIYMAALSWPPLSTVAQPTYRLGTLAGRMLINRIRRPDRAGPPRTVTLNPVLRLRESTRRLRPGGVKGAR